MNELKSEVRKIRFIVGAIIVLAVILMSSSFVLSARDTSGAAVLSTDASPDRAQREAYQSDIESASSTETKKVETLDANTSNDAHSFEDMDLQARSAFVWDIKNDEALYAKNETRTHGLASLTKIMTSVVALEHAPPAMHISVNQDHLGQYGNSGLYVDELWEVKDLATFSMLTSANDAAYALASGVGSFISGDNEENGREFFVSLMNRTARDLGLTSLFFSNPTGLDLDEDAGGAYGSAQDIARLTQYALTNHPDVLYATRHPERMTVSLSDHTHLLVNTNPFVSETHGIIASKTGYTDIAGGNLVVVFDADLNHPVVAVVMGSTFNGRFRDMDTIIETTRSHVTTQ